jgi:glyoxylate utilization-related uncharacterized protein
MLEVFFGLEGTVSCRVGDDTHSLEPGGCVLVSSGTLHTYSNPQDQPGKFLVMRSPGGLEKYFSELPGLVATYGAPLPADIDSALRARYDMIGPER